jgi:aryl-alcohol dehydrogenase-like predicted oxidoreductase
MHTNELQTTQLGHTGLHITRIGFGAWAIGGGGYEFGWGPQDDDQSIDAIHRALSLGLNWIDTAAGHGFGRSEEIVGRALQGIDQRPALAEDDWRKHDARFQEPRLSRHLAVVERLQAVADRHGATPGAVAVAWTLLNPAVDGAIVGFRRPDQVDPLVAAASLELSADDRSLIQGA